MSDSQTVRDIMAALSEVMEISVNKAELIAKVFKGSSVEVIKTSPYKLCEVSGIGFYTAENITRHFGGKPDDEERIQGCIFYAMEHFEIMGHVCIPESSLTNKIYKELNRGYPREVVSKDLCRRTINSMIRFKKLTCETFADRSGNLTRMIYTMNSHSEESKIVSNILRLISKPFDNKLNEALENAIEEYSQNNTFALGKIQKKAAITSLANKISVITGGPGTGKTTTVQSLLYAHEKVYKNKSKPLLLAPTGRAARRLSEATGYPASTIHSAIGYHQGENGDFVTVDKLDANYILVDESSMIDQHIMSSFISTVPDDAQLVLIGDPDRLPSVGYGNILHDIINSGVVPVTKLEIIFRQGKDSPIVKNSQKVLKGDTDLDFSQKGFYMCECNNDGLILKESCKLYRNCVKRFGIDNVVLLTPLRKETPVSVKSFNKQLQHIINPRDKSSDSLCLDTHDVQFRKNDKVMQMKNTETAKNGDIGYIKDICYAYDPQNENNFSTISKIEFNNDGVTTNYSQENMKNVELAYASTVHKSQGSEYKTVIIVMSDSHRTALRRNLIYTAITRASENVIIVGQKSALDYAVKNNQADTRYTCLSHRLKAVMTSRKKQNKGGGERNAAGKVEQLSLL
ncbi:MAG: AAA family ATPase [Oscillospiraceae bacterium]|nr:AAA family ATPase [Oscillospiraceae bacterium]